MRLCHITPPALLRALEKDLGNTHLILEHIVREYPEYRDFYKARLAQGDTVILDSSAYESRQGTSTAGMVQALHALAPQRPTYVVLPDSRDATPTQNVRKAFEAARALLDFRVPYIAVPHGLTLSQYRDSARQLAQIGQVKVFGLSFSLGVPQGIPRSILMQGLQDFGRAFHLLGTGADMEDLYDEYLVSHAMSLDTCKLVQQGIRGILVVPGDPAPAYEGRDRGYFDLASTPHLDVVRENLRMWNTVVSW